MLAVLGIPAFSTTRVEMQAAKLFCAIAKAFSGGLLDVRIGLLEVV